MQPNLCKSLGPSKSSYYSQYRTLIFIKTQLYTLLASPLLLYLYNEEIPITQLIRIIIFVNFYTDFGLRCLFPHSVCRSLNRVKVSNTLSNTLHDKFNQKF